MKHSTAWRIAWRFVCRVVRNISLALSGLSLGHAAQAETSVERGAYLVNSVMSCGVCHTPRGPNGPLDDKRFSGGSQTFAETEYTVKGSNITPDEETGIGKWSALDIKRALTEGQRPDGSRLAPAMPFAFYRSLTPGDLDSVVAYLQSLPAVRNSVSAPIYRGPSSESSMPGDRTAAIPPNQGDRVVRGRYLADLAHCMDCHARGPDGRQDFVGSLGKGGYVMRGPFGAVLVRNITSHPTAGIGAWSDDEVRRALTHGVARDGRPFMPPMARAAYYSRMTTEDLDALVAYVRSLPPLANDEPAVSLTRVVTLGTQGGPLTVGRRAQPANAVVVGDRIYLVDAGNGVLGQLARAKLDYRRIDQIFVTHNHSDHNADWGTVMGLQWTTGRSTPVTVYGPAGTQDMLKGFLQYFEPHARIWAAGMPSRRPARELLHARDIGKVGLIYEDDKVKVTAAEACHFHFGASAFPPDAVPKAYAFRFQTKDKVIVFSGDTGACPGLIEFAKDADVLVHEVISLNLIADTLRKVMASRPDKGNPEVFDSLMRHMAEDHTTAEDIGRLANAAGVKKVVLTHFTPGGDSDPESAYTDGVRKHFTGPVVAADDLMSF